MKLDELLLKIDKSDENKSIIILQNLFNDLLPGIEIINTSIYENLEIFNRLTCYWINVLRKTEYEYGTKHVNFKEYYVGRRAYYLDDKLVCVSSDIDTNSEEFSYVSLKAALKLKKFLYKLYLSKKVIDFDEDVPDTYSLYRENLILDYHNEALYREHGYGATERVNIVGIPDDDKNGVIIQFSNGEQKIVDIDTLSFEYHTVDDVLF